MKRLAKWILRKEIAKLENDLEWCQSQRMPPPYLGPLVRLDDR